MTGNEIIQAALEELGILAAGEGTAPADQALGQRRLNALLDQWKTRRLLIYQVVRSEVAFAASTPSYTLGSGGDWNIARPIFIQGAAFVDDNGAESPIDVLDDRDWAALSQKDSTADRPTALWCDRTIDANSRATVYVWPVPTASGTLALYLPTAISEITTFTSALVLPPGYRNALIYTLAERLAPAFNREISDDLRKLAREARADLERINSQPPRISTDPYCRDGGFFDFDVRSTR